MLPLTREQSRLTTTSLVILAAAVITVALKATKIVMVPFVLAVFFSVMLAPLVDVLHARVRFPRVLAVLCAVLVALGLLTLLGLLLSLSTRGLLASADIYQERFQEAVTRWLSVLDRYGLDLGQQSFIDAAQRIPIPQLMRRAAGTVLGWITSGILVLIFLIYLLSGRRRAAPRTGLSADMDQKIRRYIITKIGTSATTGLLVAILLSVIGLDLAVVFGILAFFLNFIPNLGSIVATLLPLPLALIQFESLWPVILVVALPGLVQLTIGNGIEPILMGQGLELHPLAVLLALLFWGILWGVAGMFLAAPMTAVLRMLLDRFETTRPVANLLAGRLPALLSGERPPTPVPAAGRPAD